MTGRLLPAIVAAAAASLPAAAASPVDDGSGPAPRFGVTAINADAHDLASLGAFVIDLDRTSLLGADGVPTALGRAYRAAARASGDE